MIQLLTTHTTVKLFDCLHTFGHVMQSKWRWGERGRMEGGVRVEKWVKGGKRGGR